MTQNLTDAPVCRRSGVLTVAVAADATVRLRCRVDADPDAPVNFHWTIATGRETALVSRDTTTAAAATTPADSPLSSVIDYKPRRDADFGLLQCWAKNDVGNQKEPCLFNIVKEGEH